MNPPHPDWTTLPTETLSHILHLLNSTTTDLRRLRSVCSTWRTALTPLKPPLKFPLIIPGSKPNTTKTFYISQTVFYLISPKKTNTTNTTLHPWITRVVEIPSPLNKWVLQNPFSRVTDFQPLPNIKAKINFLDYNISEITTSYSLKVDKIVMFPKTEANYEQGFSLLALHVNGNLGLWKSGTEEWVIVTKEDDCRFSDVIVYDNAFYVTDLKGKLKCINPITFEVKDMITSNVDVCDGMFTYLVESCGKLYLVNKVINTKACYLDACYRDKETSRMVRTRVFREALEPLGLGVWVLSDCCKTVGECGVFWKPTWSMEDRVFFVSEYVTFSLSKEEAGLSRGNCIFFNQEGFMGHGYYCYGDEDCNDLNHTYKSELQLFSRFCGIYYVNEGAITTTSNITLPREFKIFWPVPSWLVSN